MEKAIQILLHRYKCLKCELEELIEERDRYGRELAQKIDTQMSSITLENNTTPIISKEVLLLYKVLAKHLHPDKGGSTKIFSEIYNLYSTNNYTELLYLAYKYEIPVQNICKSLIVETIDDITHQIEMIQKTAPYVWGHLKEDKKPDFENWLIENHNFKKREI